jgi:hypothetical protein
MQAEAWGDRPVFIRPVRNRVSGVAQPATNAAIPISPAIALRMIFPFP